MLNKNTSESLGKREMLCCLTFADCRLQTADSRLQTADYRSQTAYSEPQTVDYERPLNLTLATNLEDRKA